MATTIPGIGGEALERIKGGRVAAGRMLLVALDYSIDELLCGGSWNVVGNKTITAYEWVGMWLRIEHTFIIIFSNSIFMSDLPYVIDVF